MEFLLVFSIISFAAMFGAVYYLNTVQGFELSFTPPYYFKTGDWISLFNAFSFVFVVSLLFFGMGAPIALGAEGLKYASLYSLSGMHWFDFSFILPEFIACFAAISLAQGVLSDYEGRESIKNYFHSSVKNLLLGLALLCFLIIARGIIVK